MRALQPASRRGQSLAQKAGAPPCERRRRSVLSLFRSALNLVFLAALCLASFAWAEVITVHSESECVDFFVKIAQNHPTTAATVDRLKEFARVHNLPTKIVEVGPPERRVKRLIVGLNFHDWNLMQEYMKWFNLESAGRPDLGGILPLEYATEMDRANGKNYVGTNVRPRPSMSAPIWMFGREDVPWQQWWDVSVKHPKAVEADLPIMGFSHLIGTTPEQQKNIWEFLYNPDKRAVCKSTNCVAWQSQIEFGHTDFNIPEVERQFLATRLGFSRTMEHSEMTRRMFHYANQEHGAMIAFLNGQKGIDAFNSDLASHLPPPPKKSAREAVKGITFSRNTELDEAISKIPDMPGGTKVFLPIGPGASPEGMEALAELAAKSNGGIDVHVFVNGVSERVFQEGLDKGKDKLRIHALFLGGNLRKLHSEGRVHHIPGYLGDFAHYMRDPNEKDFQYDAIIVRVSPPDANGHYSLGPNSDLVKTVLETRPNIKIIAEINPNVPFTTGDNFLTKDQIAGSFHSTTQLGGPAALPLTKVEQNIGENLAGLIENGATLQVGIGNVFGGLPEALKNAGRRGLNISTEMMGDDLKKIVENGTAQKAETTFGYGSTEFYKWLDHNPDVVFKPTEVINDPARVSSIPNFHAVNTALQVDLHGQVNATMGPQGRISSPGGQVEFMSGASRSTGGKSIIALRSTAKQGELSTIDVDLYAGPITTPREYISHVVTEYGVAKLSGKSDRDRAVALINVAHPKFRKSLANKAVEKGIITAGDVSHIRFDVAEIKPNKDHKGPEGQENKKPPTDLPARADHEGNVPMAGGDPVPQTRTAAPDADPKAAILKQSTLQGKDFNYKVYGEENKETIVLVHGVGSSLWSWKDIAPLLADRYKVVVYDQRGHGKTPDSGENYSSTAMADDLRALLDHLGIKKAHLLGHSMGGRAVVRFAERYPERTHSVIVEDMHMKGSGTASLKLPGVRVQAEKMKAEIPATFASAPEAKARLLNYFLEEQVEDILKRAAHDPDGKVTLAGRPEVPELWLHQGLSEDMTEALRNVRSPIVFIGADPSRPDAALKGAGVDHIRETRPDIPIWQLPGTGHKVHNDPKFMESVRYFLGTTKTRAVTEPAREALIKAAKEAGVPIFMRQVGDRELPVVLLNEETYPKLKPFLDGSIGTGVKMFPFTNQGTDHGLFRVGDNLLDFYWPDDPNKYGQLHNTGVYALPLQTYLPRRNNNSERIIEATYALTPEERQTAEYYHRMRRAGVFRAKYEFNNYDPAYGQRKHVLDEGFQNCYNFGVSACNQSHANNMKTQLYQIGVRDVPKLLATPEVKEFQRRAKEQLLAINRNDPALADPKAEEKVLNIHMFDKPEYFELLKNVIPENSSPENRTKFINYLVGIDAVQQYDQITTDLSLGGNFWNFNHPRATAIVVWDTPLQNEAFKNGTYEIGGSNPAYQFRNPSLNRPLP